MYISSVSVIINYYHHFSLTCKKRPQSILLTKLYEWVWKEGTWARHLQYCTDTNMYRFYARLVDYQDRPELNNHGWHKSFSILFYFCFLRATGQSRVHACILKKKKSPCRTFPYYGPKDMLYKVDTNGQMLEDKGIITMFAIWSPSKLWVFLLPIPL